MPAITTIFLQYTLQEHNNSSEKEPPRRQDAIETCRRRAASCEWALYSQLGHPATRDMAVAIIFDQGSRRQLETLLRLGYCRINGRFKIDDRRLNGANQAFLKVEMGQPP